MILNYIEHLHILICMIIGCVSVARFVSLAVATIGITSPLIGYKFV